MLAVLNKRWLSKGWRVMDPADSELMALTWIEILNRHKIPYEHYFELYHRSLDLRIRLMNEGKNADDFSADMMAACWPSLEKELREREINAGRTLTTTAQTNCLRCFGTGFERVFDDAGQYLGTRNGCKHEYIDESDPSGGGIDEAIAAIKISVAKEETAEEICKRVGRLLHREFITVSDDADGVPIWNAMSTWRHAEKYCREIDAAKVVEMF